MNADPYEPVEWRPLPVATPKLSRSNEDASGMPGNPRRRLAARDENAPKKAEKESGEEQGLSDETAPPAHLTPAQKLYLSTLARLPVPLPRLALRNCGIHRSNLSRWRRDPAFFEAEQEAGREIVEQLVASAADKAINGTLRPIYQMGVLVGHERVYSEKLHIELLRAFRPEQFRPTAKHSTTTNNTVVLATPAEVAEAVRKLSFTRQTY